MCETSILGVSQAQQSLTAHSIFIIIILPIQAIASTPSLLTLHSLLLLPAQSNQGLLSILTGGSTSTTGANAV
jgi:hypothetical protein